jgi:hypothetical protein
LHEFGRSIYRSIEVLLRREIDHRARLMGFEQAGDELAISDVALHEQVPLVAGNCLERIEVARIRELIEVYDGVRFFGEPLTREATADETGAAGNQNGFHRDPSCEWGAVASMRLALNEVTGSNRL